MDRRDVELELKVHEDPGACTLDAAGCGTMDFRRCRHTLAFRLKQRKRLSRHFTFPFKTTGSSSFTRNCVSSTRSHFSTQFITQPTPMRNGLGFSYNLCFVKVVGEPSLKTIWVTLGVNRVRIYKNQEGDGCECGVARLLLVKPTLAPSQFNMFTNSWPASAPSSIFTST